MNTNSGKQAGLGLFRATGIYVGAILGSGILVLPAIAAKEAGRRRSWPGRRLNVLWAMLRDGTTYTRSRLRQPVLLHDGALHERQSAGSFYQGRRTAR